MERERERDKERKREKGRDKQKETNMRIMIHCYFLGGGIYLLVVEGRARSEAMHT